MTLTTRDSSLETEVSQEVPEYLEGNEDLSKTPLTSEPAALKSQDSGKTQAKPSDMVPKSSLISLQESDPTLSGVREHVVSESEAAMMRVCYYKQDEKVEPIGCTSQ